MEPLWVDIILIACLVGFLVLCALCFLAKRWGDKQRKIMRQMKESRDALDAEIKEKMGKLL